MKNIRSTLREQVSMLTLNNNSSNSLTYKTYNVCYKSNASIIPINVINNIPQYEIIIPKPPSIFYYTSFVGVEWNNKYYQFITMLQNYCDKFIKSNKCSQKRNW